MRTRGHQAVTRWPPPHPAPPPRALRRPDTRGRTQQSAGLRRLPAGAETRGGAAGARRGTRLAAPPRSPPLPPAPTPLPSVPALEPEPGRRRRRQRSFGAGGSHSSLARGGTGSGGGGGRAPGTRLGTARTGARRRPPRRRRTAAGGRASGQAERASCELQEPGKSGMPGSLRGLGALRRGANFTHWLQGSVP